MGRASLTFVGDKKSQQTSCSFGYYNLSATFLLWSLNLRCSSIVLYAYQLGLVDLNVCNTELLFRKSFLVPVSTMVFSTYFSWRLRAKGLCWGPLSTGIWFLCIVRDKEPVACLCVNIYIPFDQQHLLMMLSFLSCLPLWQKPYHYNMCTCKCYMSPSLSYN